MFLGKDVLKICSIFTGEHSCGSVISMKLHSNFIEITLLHGCSLVNMLHIFRTPFPKNTSEQAASGVTCIYQQKYLYQVHRVQRPLLLIFRSLTYV